MKKVFSIKDLLKNQECKKFDPLTLGQYLLLVKIPKFLGGK
jgi:hypothetical protein